MLKICTEVVGWSPATSFFLCFSQSRPICQPVKWNCSQTETLVQRRWAILAARLCSYPPLLSPPACLPLWLLYPGGDGVFTVFMNLASPVRAASLHRGDCCLVWRVWWNESCVISLPYRPRSLRKPTWCRNYQRKSNFLVRKKFKKMVVISWLDTFEILHLCVCVLCDQLTRDCFAERFAVKYRGRRDPPSPTDLETSSSMTRIFMTWTGFIKCVEVMNGVQVVVATHLVQLIS